MFDWDHPWPLSRCRVYGTGNTLPMFIAGGTASRTVRRPTLRVHCRQRRDWQEHGLEVTVQGQPDHEEEADGCRSQPESGHQQRTVWHHQPVDARVEGWYVD